MIWKPGDRAVFCYRPDSGVPWLNTDFPFIGRTGITTASTFIDSQGVSRIPFLFDGDFETQAPVTKCLAPILEDPFAAIPKGEHIHA